jgi:nucleotide-binding universal stress UspA family protein
MPNHIKILVATDFTPAADNALTYADTLFRKWLGMEVEYLLVHAFKPLVPYSNTPSMPVINNVELEKALKAKLEVLKSDLVKHLNDEKKVRSYFEQGSLNKAIQNIITKEKPDLIVMGTREKSAFQRMTVGSNTTEVANTVACPILAVPREAEPNELTNMVLATDLKSLSISSSSFSLLERLLNFEQLKLEVLQVYSTENEAQQSEKRSGSAIHSQFEKMKHKHVSIVNRSKYKGINSYIEENNTSLLILENKESGFFEKIFHTEIAEKMVYHSQIPVLLLN